MGEKIRRARNTRELKEPLASDCDASSIPSPDKRPAYALEHIADRMNKVDQKFSEVLIALESFAAATR